MVRRRAQYKKSGVSDGVFFLFVVGVIGTALLMYLGVQSWDWDALLRGTLLIAAFVFTLALAWRLFSYRRSTFHLMRFLSRRFVDIEELEQVRAMHPDECESFMLNLFLREGYRGERTPHSDDKGIDLHLWDKSGKYYAVQVKRYGKNHFVRPNEIRDFRGAYASKNGSGIFITTSDFTPKAREWAEAEKMILINGRDLAGLMRHTTL